MREIERIVETYSDTLLRLAMHHVNNLAEAQDVVQDVYLKYMKKHPAFNDFEHEKAWLMRIAINTCKDYRRTAWFRHIDNRKALEELPDRLLRTEAEDRSLSLMIMDLPNRYKQVVLLYYFQGFTQAETAAVLGISPSSVLRRLRNAEALLKQSLTGGEEHER